MMFLSFSLNVYITFTLAVLPPLIVKVFPSRIPPSIISYVGTPDKICDFSATYFLSEVETDSVIATTDKSYESSKSAKFTTLNSIVYTPVRLGSSSNSSFVRSIPSTVIYALVFTALYKLASPAPCLRGEYGLPCSLRTIDAVDINN